jgi:Baseplate J-like protein
MTNNLEHDVRAIVASMDNQEKEQDPQNQPEDMQDIYVLIVTEHEAAADQTQIVDSTPLAPTQPAPVIVQQDSFLSAYLFVCFSLFLIFATLTFQCYCIFNPLTATVTIIPTSQQVTLNGTMQLGRVLPALTISQSQTTPTTGHGHHLAEQASGYLTFYNGQFQSVSIAAGTMLTGNDGIPIITDQDVVIPAANPPSFGQVTIAAHAINAGVQGNIPAYDINQACCATSVLIKNTGAFTGGQNERDFSTVSAQDIHKISTPLKISVTQSVAGALQSQLTSQEQLQLLPCTPTVTSDHQPGEEATTVNVTVSATCSAIAYNSQELETKATSYLAIQAQQKAGAGYSLFGTVNVSVKQASVSSIPPHLVFLSFHATGTWIYGISQQSQQQIKHLIAGKTTLEAQQLVAALPGVESAAIRFSGFGDATRIPKTTRYVHVIVIVV